MGQILRTLGRGVGYIRTIVCTWCKKEFETSKPGRIVYCGPECRVEARKQQTMASHKTYYSGTHRSWECQREQKRIEADAAKARKKNAKAIDKFEAEARARGLS